MEVPCARRSEPKPKISPEKSNFFLSNIFFFKKSKKIGLKLPESLKTNSELFSRRISNNFDQRFLGLENNINDILAL